MWYSSDFNTHTKIIFLIIFDTCSFACVIIWHIIPIDDLQSHINIFGFKILWIFYADNPHVYYVWVSNPFNVFFWLDLLYLFQNIILEPEEKRTSFRAKIWIYFESIRFVKYFIWVPQINYLKIHMRLWLILENLCEILILQKLFFIILFGYVFLQQTIVPYKYRID